MPKYQKVMQHVASHERDVVNMYVTCLQCISIIIHATTKDDRHMTDRKIDEWVNERAGTTTTRQETGGDEHILSHIQSETN